VGKISDPLNIPYPRIKDVSQIFTHPSEVLKEAGLLRAAALNLGFGAVPQFHPQSRPQACKKNDARISV
jgi:hypothetical protein